MGFFMCFYAVLLQKTYKIKKPYINTAPVISNVFYPFGISSIL
jgi:hypothetical protein